MRFTFYRPKTINTIEFENIIGKLNYDLYMLENEKADEWDVYNYVYGISKHIKPLDKNPQMAFLGFDEPDKMPSDARVDYFYRPTYIATAIMMKAILLFPSLLNEGLFLDSELEFSVDTVKKTITSLMLASTGRNFDGAGVMKLSECNKFFIDAGAEEFLKKYPELCPEFTQLFTESKQFVDSGEISDSERWYMH